MPPFSSQFIPAYATPTAQPTDAALPPPASSRLLACGAVRRRVLSDAPAVNAPDGPLSRQDAATCVAQATADIYHVRPLAFIDDFDHRRAVTAVAAGAPAYLYSASDANAPEASRLAVSAMERGLAAAIAEWGEDGYGAACGYCLRHLIPLNGPARVELALWIYDAIEIRLVDAPKYAPVTPASRQNRRIMHNRPAMQKPQQAPDTSCPPPPSRSAFLSDAIHESQS